MGLTVPPAPCGGQHGPANHDMSADHFAWLADFFPDNGSLADLSNASTTSAWLYSCLSESARKDKIASSRSRMETILFFGFGGKTRFMFMPGTDGAFVKRVQEKKIAYCIDTCAGRPLDPLAMKLHSGGKILVATEYGVGEYEPATRELETAGGNVWILPAGSPMRLATDAEVAEFRLVKASVAAELIAYYSTAGYKGD